MLLLHPDFTQPKARCSLAGVINCITVTNVTQFGWFPQDLGWFSSSGSVPWVGTAPGCVCALGGAQHLRPAACSRTLSSDHAGAPSPWQQGTNRAVLGGCLQAVAGSCYGAWQAGERSPPEGHCQPAWLLRPAWHARFPFPPSAWRAEKAGWTHTGVCLAVWQQQQQPAEAGVKGRWHSCWFAFWIHSAASPARTSCLEDNGSSAPPTWWKSFCTDNKCCFPCISCQSF